MRKSSSAAAAVMGVVAFVSGQPAAATPFFSTGDTDGKIATATRPGVPGGAFEIESADDFILTQPTTLTSATFTGLVPHNSSTLDVVVEIYRVFPADSNVGRTSGPNTTPPFSTPEVPTRLNSPSDVALVSRNSASPGELSFTTTGLQTDFTSNNSVQPGGIHPKPGQTTGGNGAVTGDEVEYDVTFTSPITLGPDHYFFVPQVELDNGNNFLWLSAPKPITGGTGPFAPDLQSWTRDEMLAPDWLRVGTDIVGGSPTPPTFNETFSLTGIVPEPGTLAVFGTGLLGLVLLGRPRSRR